MSGHKIPQHHDRITRNRTTGTLRYGTMAISQIILISQAVSCRWLWSCAERWEKSPEKSSTLRELLRDARNSRIGEGAPESVANKREQQRVDFVRNAIPNLSQRNFLPEALVPKGTVLIARYAPRRKPLWADRSAAPLTTLFHLPKKNSPIASPEGTKLGVSKRNFGSGRLVELRHFHSGNFWRRVGVATF